MKVVFAFPGRNFSGNFLRQWSETLVVLSQKGIDVRMVQEYSSFVSFSRMKTLGLDVLRGKDQKPFGGHVDYDVWFTIDSDIYFTPEQVLELIEDTKTHPVVSGYYRMQDMKHYAVVEDWDLDYFRQHGTFKFLTVQDMNEKKKEKYMTVAYNGMGFFACRKGVIEKMEYPYFDHEIFEFKDKNGKIIRDMCSEDVAFCKNLNKAGFDVVVNTQLLVGHEKTLVI